MENATPEKDFDLQEWGDGRVVSHWGEDKWVMYDPEDDAVSLSDMR